MHPFAVVASPARSVLEVPANWVVGSSIGSLPFGSLASALALPIPLHTHTYDFRNLQIICLITRK